MALKRIKVVEMLGLAPGPFCGTILADFGASVIVVSKLQQPVIDVMSNGKRILPLDMKSKEGKRVIRNLCKSSDVLIDTFRPGVMEKLGLGPEILSKDNPGLIYARLTGYGQDGSYKHRAGHDLNYIAISGVLSMLAKNNVIPTPPNLLADFAGGSLMCSLGILLALFERQKSGKGQVVDCSMTEGAAYLATWIFKSQNQGIWGGKPGTNLLDGGMHFYGTYKTKDGKFITVGAIEPQFYLDFLKGLHISEEEHTQWSNQEEKKLKLQNIFLSRTQKEWCEIFEKLDACVEPVLDFETVDKHECNKSRQTFYRNVEGLVIPEPAPRLSLTPGESSGKKPIARPGQHTVEILTEIGYTLKEIEELRNKGYIMAEKKSKL